MFASFVKFLTLVLLALISSHIATARVLFVGTKHAALIGLQQMTVLVGAAIRVTRINRRAAREQSHRIGESAVVLQGAQLGVGIDQVAGAVETTAIVAAQVVASGLDRALTVSSRVVRDNTVPE
jgi:hypothetical protein